MSFDNARGASLGFLAPEQAQHQVVARARRRDVQQAFLLRFVHRPFGIAHIAGSEKLTTPDIQDVRPVVGHQVNRLRADAAGGDTQTRQNHDWELQAFRAMDRHETDGILIRVGYGAFRIVVLLALARLEPIAERAQGRWAAACERARPRDHVPQAAQCISRARAPKRPHGKHAIAYDRLGP